MKILSKCGHSDANAWSVLSAEMILGVSMKLGDSANDSGWLSETSPSS